MRLVFLYFMVMILNINCLTSKTSFQVAKRHLNNFKLSRIRKIREVTDYPFVTYATHIYSGNFTWMPDIMNLQQNDDGSYKVDFNEAPATCFLASNSTFFCAGVLLSDSYVLTAAECLTGRSPFSGPNVHGLEMVCGSHSDVARYSLLHRISNILIDREFADLNLKKLRKYSLAVARVSPIVDPKRDTGQAYRLNFPPWPYSSKEKQKKELADLYTFCFVYSKRSQELHIHGDKTALIIANVLSRKECFKANFLVKANEFCMVVDSPAKGPCEFVKGGPVCCGKDGILEGILIVDSPENCQSRERYLLAARVDHYIPFIWRSLSLPLTTVKVSTTTSMSTTATTPKPALVIRNYKFQYKHLALAAVYCFLIVAIPLLIFVKLSCKCENVQKWDFSRHENVSWRCQVSPGVMITFFLMISRVFLYCRLREGVEKQIAWRKEKSGLPGSIKEIPPC